MTSEYGTQVASGKPAVIIYGVKVAAKVKNNKKERLLFLTIR